jgi:uncharacterized protein YxjI
LDQKLNEIKCWEVKLKKKISKSILKAKQVAAKRMNIKINTNTNWKVTFNFWKGLHEIRGDERERRERKKIHWNLTITPLYTHDLPTEKGWFDALNVVVEGSIWPQSKGVFCAIDIAWASPTFLIIFIFVKR